MSAVTGAWHHDDVVRLLSRETPYTVGSIETMVLQLAALGWTQHQVRRGITTISRTGLSFDSLLRGAGLTDDVDAFLDALAGGHDVE